MSPGRHKEAVWLILFAILVLGCAAIRRDEGSDVQLACDLPIPREYTLEWKRDAEVILRYTSTSGAAVVPSANFAGRVSLVGMDLGITSVRGTDSGNFYCSITNLATSDLPVTSARQTLTVDVISTSTDDAIARQNHREDCGKDTGSGLQLTTVVLITAAAGLGGMLAGVPVVLGLLCRTICRNTGRDDDSRVFHPAEVDFL